MSGKKVALGALAVALIGGTVWLAYDRRGSAPAARPVEVGREEPAAVKAEPPKESGSDVNVSVDKAIAQSNAMIRPIEWPGAVKWDGKSQMPPETLAKAIAVVSRYDENFRRIRTLSLHDVQSKTALKPLPFDVSRQSWDVEVEGALDPAFFKVKGQYLGAPIDSTVTPAGKIGGGQSIGFAESIAPPYFTGPGPWNDTNLSGDLQVSEDVALPPDVSNLEASRHLKHDGNARYDTLSYSSRDGVDVSYWFSRETGMLDYYVSRKQKVGDGENPFQSVTVTRYCKAGDVYYPAEVTSLTDTSYLAVLIDGAASGRTPSRGFDCAAKRLITGIVINGVPASAEQ